MAMNELDSPGTSSGTDEQLFVAMQAGDTSAFGHLYDRYNGRALRVARAVAHNVHDAEDAVQEAFISVWASRHSYRAQYETAAPWVLTIVRHRTIDLVQRRSRDHAHTDFGEAARAEPACVGFETEVEDRDQARAMHVLLQSLPDKQREVVVLAFFGELTHAEIAERLSLPLGTVKGRMRLGLTRLAGTAELKQKQ